jgi:photosystem II stability/assembly factor-like uncharacterized protein
MRRLAVALWAAIVAAVMLAGCGAGAPSGRVTGGGTSSAAAAPSERVGSPRSVARPAMTGSPPAGLLQGKYQAVAIAFPSRGIGIAAISGYAGDSTTVRSWIERTTDGGRHWVAGLPALGQDQAAAQTGLAFVSAQQGWAYGPGLLFSRDGGVTWRAERTPFPLVGPVTVAGTSTWVVGYGCAGGDCPAVIYTVGRVGGDLQRLADQPASTGSVIAMQRPTTQVAWLLFAGPHGLRRLVTTSDAGRSWSARSLPCPVSEPAGQLSAAGPVSLWLVCEGTPQAQFVPGVLYRTVDGGRTWTRMAAEDSLGVYAVSNRAAWAVQDGPSDSVIVRTTDGGRTWHTVLSRANPDTIVEAFVPLVPDGAEAVALVVSTDGSRFVAYTTRDFGQTWQATTLPT